MPMNYKLIVDDITIFNNKYISSKYKKKNLSGNIFTFFIFHITNVWYLVFKTLTIMKKFLFARVWVPLWSHPCGHCWGYVLLWERIPKHDSRKAVRLKRVILDSSMGWVSNGVVVLELTSTLFLSHIVSLLGPLLYGLAWLLQRPCASTFKICFF